MLKFEEENFYLRQIVVEELADAIAEEAVCEHVGDLLQILCLDRGHIANVLLSQSMLKQVLKMERLTIRIVFAIVLSIGKISVWCLFRSVNGPGKKQGMQK